jgi:glycosyltransferase involved in cell wall biosynthesis
MVQTMTDWEIVVVDDASPDDIAAALAPWRDDERVRLIRHERNAGATAARNTGIAATLGRFIAFLDADDSWLPTKLERQVNAVLACAEPERVFCVTQTIVNLADGRHVIRPRRAKRPDESMDEFIFVHAGFCQTSSFLVSRSLAAVTGFRELSTGEDHLFAIDLCNAGATYLLIDSALTVYNDDLRPGRLSNRRTLDRGRAFMDEVRGLISPKAMLGYEARYLGVLLLRHNPFKGSALVARAVVSGALPPRFAASLLVRAALPADLYHTIRARLLGRGGA